jgi:glycosyltransferase involved in cell wall biosynthesis
VNLGIISDAHHYWDARGRLCVLSPVARQFEQWAQLFDHVTVCAPLARGLPPATHSAYEARNIDLLPVRVAGGNTIAAKVELALQVVPWWRAIRTLLERVDAVHIRCPNNISIVGLLALERSTCLRQAVYTGTWMGYPTEPRTYRWQREYLRDRFSGPVAVYGAWPDQPPHVVASFSPSYRDADWAGETAAVAGRLERLRTLAALPRPVALLSVGGLDRNKNQRVAIRAVKALAALNVDARLDILGDGPERAGLAQLIDELGLQDRVVLHGSTSPADVRRWYREADFVIQPTRSEGFGKVPIEAFFHGVIPIMSDVNLHPQFAGSGDDARGRCFPTEDPDACAAHVADLASRPGEMMRMIANGREYARQFTLEAWQVHVRDMLQTHWRRQLG